MPNVGPEPSYISLLSVSEKHWLVRALISLPGTKNSMYHLMTYTCKII